ncbi:SDR family NAD(P)-dependent oxidoreductase [Imperialibacter roseus]|uniref:SDR family NAD(P)-dependent oxidoreductase n=1 Tax=Imperialibacter roseus TaxID=1324217 RepID=A0ABZ0IUT7_9BACT|nr:SDR family NAD(P)-dependent oxidoreductase [Imperialibacter roseus]WOK08154.1 SDR family NAD(P)-dependent oxidoreductase [Imperialibacter roseus]|tara:strand:+ start:3931 stop:4683 length:753 start_codon:yes stop_codon:yes gene_type:complete
MKKIALITGATSGIGKSTAHYLADQFYLIICGRRRDKLEELAHNLRTETDVHVLSFDVRDQRAVNQAIESLPSNWKDIDVLINNAGNAHGMDVIHEGSTQDWDDMIDINVKGLLYVSKAIIPGMVEKKSGFIVNIGSIAGKEVYPKGNVYCASKHAVDAITNGMRLDLNPYGIRVTGIHPGLVETEFSLVRFKGDEEKAKQVYKGMKPLTGDDVADVIKYVVTRPPHVLLSDIVLFPTAQASATMVHRES